MKISPKLPTTLRYLLVTFGILLILVGYYWFYYIPFRDAYFTSRNLRVLSDMSQSITTVVESYKGQLDKNFINPERSLTQLIKTQNRRYRWLPQQKLNNLAGSLVSSQTTRIRHLNYERSRFELGTELFENNRIYDSLDLQSEIHYSLSLKESGYALQLNYRGKGVPKDTLTRDQPYSLELDAFAPLKDIMDPILVPDIFDNMLIVEHSDIAKHDGRVIYQADQREFQAIRLDSVTSKLKDTWSSYHEDVIWGNTRYKIFVQPIRLALIDQPDGSETAVREWMLIGLVNADVFGAATRRISRFDMSQWAFLFFLILFSIPLIKMSFIGEREELKRTDLRNGVFAIFVLAGILTFWLLSVFSDTETLDDLDNSALTPLAEEIESNFSIELDRIISQFNEIEGGFTSRIQRINQTIEEDKLRLTGYTIPKVFHPASKVFDEGEVLEMNYPYFTQFAWIDSAGVQTRKIGPRPDITPLVSVRHRPYFQRIINQSYWHDEKGNPFFIQPIISFTTGENIAMVTKPSSRESNEPVMAMSVDFISLKNPVLPAGFGYCIINDQGQVLFHSDSEKNMQENFYEECNGSPDLRAVVFSKTSRHLSVNYLGNEHRLYSKPFQNIPEWTLVTFANLSEVRSSQLTALFSAFLIYATLILVFLGILMIFFKYRYFESLQWFWPREAKNEQYQAYSIFLFGLAGLFYYSIFYLPAGLNVFAAFVIPILGGIASSLFFQRRSVIPQNLAQRASFTMSGLPLSQQRHSSRIYLLGGAALSLLVFWLLGWNLLLYTMMGISLGLILNFDPVTDFISTKHFPLYYARYALCGVAFFLISSILPSIAFFKMAYDTEKEVLLRRGQLSLYHGMEARQVKINNLLNDFSLSNTTTDGLRGTWDSLETQIDIYHNFYLASRFSENVEKYNPLFDQGQSSLLKLRKPAASLFDPIFSGTDQEMDFSELPPNPRTSMVDKVMGFLRSSLRIVDFQNWELFRDQMGHHEWQWKRWLTYTKNFLFFRANSGLFIFSIYTPFSEPNSYLWLPGLLAILVLFYAVMLYFIHKIFGINLILPQVENGVSSILVGVDQNTIYIGQPNSGKSKVLRQLEKPKRILDLRELANPEDLEKEYEVVEDPEKHYELFILDHFDLYLDNEQWNRALLTLMEKLIGKYGKTVIMVTPVDPTLIIPRLSRVLETRNEEKGQVTQSKKVVDKTLFNRWTMLLSSFTKIYHRTYTDRVAFEGEIAQYYRGRRQADLLDHPLVIKLIEECKHSSFLQKVGLGIVHKYEIVDDFMSEEALLDEILLRAEAHYQSLWLACSIDEKITLIHLARNNFVPYKDAKVVRLLIRKGLVDAVNYRLFNESFAEFALTAESSDVIMNWKSNQDRSWDNIRTPLFTFVIAIVAFLFITQRELFTVSLAWITTIAALIPAFFRILILLRPTTFSKRSNLAGGPVGMGEFAND